MIVAHDPSGVSGVHVHAGSEAAFTLIEVVIVAVITAAMIAILAMTRGADATSAQRDGAISAARATGDAIEDFRKDHGGRPPVLGTSDWPTTPLTKLNRGPVNTYTGRAYMRRRGIEVLESGTARVVNGAATTAASVRFALQYTRSAARPGGWVIVVRDTQNRAAPCYITGGSIAIPSGSGTLC